MPSSSSEMDCLIPWSPRRPGQACGLQETARRRSASARGQVQSGLCSGSCQVRGPPPAQVLLPASKQGTALCPGDPSEGRGKASKAPMLQPAL